MISWRGVVLCSLTGSSTVVVQFYGAVTDRRAEMFLPSVTRAVVAGTRRAGARTARQSGDQDLGELDPVAPVRRLRQLGDPQHDRLGLHRLCERERDIRAEGTLRQDRARHRRARVRRPDLDVAAGTVDVQSDRLHGPGLGQGHGEADPGPARHLRVLVRAGAPERRRIAIDGAPCLIGVLVVVAGPGSASPWPW